MEKYWFVYSNGVISGPLSSDELLFKAVNEDLSKCLIWWKGVTEWIPLANHINNLAGFLQEQLAGLKSPVWQLQWGQQTMGPMGIEDLCQKIRTIPDFTKTVLVKASEREQFRPLFQYSELMERLGLNQRKNLRVPLNGRLIMTDGSRVVEAEVTSLSLGGLGFRIRNVKIQRGDQWRLELISPDFSQKLYGTGVIVFVGDGNFGLAFEQINAESQSLMSTYLLRFKREEVSQQQRAA